MSKPQNGADTRENNIRRGGEGLEGSDWIGERTLPQPPPDHLLDMAFETGCEDFTGT